MTRFEAYTKLFHRILQSSVWDLDDRTRVVWITLMAMTDEHGCVISTVNFVAKMARLDHNAQEVEDVRRAIDRFLSPDPESLTSENEGRRLEKIEGGWRLLNFKKYQEMMKVEARRETWRESKRRIRQGGHKVQAHTTGKSFEQACEDARNDGYGIFAAQHEKEAVAALANEEALQERDKSGWDALAQQGEQLLQETRQEREEEKANPEDEEGWEKV